MYPAIDGDLNRCDESCYQRVFIQAILTLWPENTFIRDAGIGETTHGFEYVPVMNFA